MGGIYTDLAMELRELDPKIEGVVEQDESDGGIEIKRIGILTETAAKKIGKAIGSYVTINADALAERPPALFDAVSKRVAAELKKMLRLDIAKSTILIIGLGNRNVTPDSLGPRVAEHIYITRHVKQYLPNALDFPAPSICALAPGVLGVTGVETSDIVRGVVETVRPDCIIAIDSLASRRAARISTTIEISDAGISPGSGVGNLRAEMSRRSLGVPVIAIGVPLVVYASTIMRDTIGFVAHEAGFRGSDQQLGELAQNAAEQHLDNMIVTPKDIDSIVDDMAGILSDGINRALYGETLPTVRELLA